VQPHGAPAEPEAPLPGVQEREDVPRRARALERNERGTFSIMTGVRPDAAASSVVFVILIAAAYDPPAVIDLIINVVADTIS
jgi:hypothetical protein